MIKAMMETRHQRAKRDVRPWRFTRQALAYALLAAPATFLAQLAVRRQADVGALLITLLAVCAAAFLIPAGVYVGSWATAVGRIHHDELIALRGAVDDLAGRVDQKQKLSELLGQLKALRSFADIINKRVPPWGDIPAGVAEDVNTWIARVSEALSPRPDLKAEFDRASNENAALAALKATTLSIRMTNRTGVLDAIIKHLSQEGGL